MLEPQDEQICGMMCIQTNKPKNEQKEINNMIPYHEQDTVANGVIPYPFECFYSLSKGIRTMVEAHWHYYIEMLYSLTGNLKVFLNGESYDFNKGINKGRLFRDT